MTFIYNSKDDLVIVDIKHLKVKSQTIKYCRVREYSSIKTILVSLRVMMKKGKVNRSPSPCLTIRPDLWPEHIYRVTYDIIIPLILRQIPR